jgi:hypothetical protein
LESVDVFDVVKTIVEESSWSIPVRSEAVSLLLLVLTVDALEVLEFSLAFLDWLSSPLAVLCLVFKTVSSLAILDADSAFLFPPLHRDGGFAAEGAFGLAFIVGSSNGF